MRKHAFTAALAVAAIGAGAAVVGAQEPTPEVGVAITPKAMTVTGADALKSGPTRLVFSTQSKERGFLLLALKDGVTREQVAEAAPKIQNPAKAEKKYGRFVASSYVTRGNEYATTVDLAGGEYVLIDMTKQPAVRAGFVVGEERSTATMPATDKSVIARDYRFSAPDGLPKSGPFLVENRGDELHHVLAFPIKRGISAKRVVKGLMRDKPRGITGPPTALTEIVSSGTKNAVETPLRKGRVLLICFLQDGPKKPPHAALGMYKAVTVR